MKDRDFTNATRKEVQELQNYLTECLVDWLMYHECAGSTSRYNLYSSVQKAVRLAPAITMLRENVDEPVEVKLKIEG